ncbi:MAG: glycosyltransferase [Dyadobacter sp.]|uniref:glycosyltransferase n=1 Tax=Dyadobacter sp. TaxID=1914288 RepID=UPI003262F59E
MTEKLPTTENIAQLTPVKKNVFVYPIVPKRLNETGNPYTEDLITSLENNNFTVINKTDDRRHGILSLFNYFFSSDIFYFNWIENLPQKKFGYIQSLLFVAQLLLMKLFRKKVIWTLHNFNSHYSDSKLYLVIQRLMLKYSSLIILHSSEATNFLKEKKVKLSKTFYFFHPFDNKLAVATQQVPVGEPKTIDILIWGAMNSYKGVLEFVKFYTEHGLKFRLHIAGKFKDKKYLEKVNEFISPEVTIDDSFIPDEQVIELHKQSRFVLFPYNGSSVLTSGALAFSLSLKSAIIGPKLGAFKELGEMGLINTFESYSDIADIMRNGNEISPLNLNKFIEEHSWDNFGKSLFLAVSQRSR